MIPQMARDHCYYHVAREASHVNWRRTRVTEQPDGAAALSSRHRVLPAKYDDRASFTVTEAGCEILGLSRSLAYASVKRGAIPTIRIGGRIVVPRIALERLLGA
jgi:excisionase family DNA binding protein